jgi:hypothetical protein
VTLAFWQRRAMRIIVIRWAQGGPRPNAQRATMRIGSTTKLRSIIGAAVLLLFLAMLGMAIHAGTGAQEPHVKLLRTDVRAMTDLPRRGYADRPVPRPPTVTILLRNEGASPVRLTAFEVVVDTTAVVENCPDIASYSPHEATEYQAIELPETADPQDIAGTPFAASLQPGDEIELTIGFLRHEWAAQYRMRVYQLSLALVVNDQFAVDLSHIALASPAVPATSETLVGACGRRNARALARLDRADLPMPAALRSLVEDARAHLQNAPR